MTGSIFIRHCSPIPVQNLRFAAQALACQRELGIDNAKLNVNGGAIAIGHPLGCSGARLATTLIHQMARTGASRGIALACMNEDRETIRSLDNTTPIGMNFPCVMQTVRRQRQNAGKCSGADSDHYE